MTENKTYSYLLERFKQTKWPYYGLNQTRFEVGNSFETDIKELREKDMIEPVPGINGWLIKIIHLEKWEI